MSEEDRDTFLLHFRSDVLPEVNQYQIELQIKQKFQTKTVGSFGICYNDMELDSFSRRLKTRQLRSEVNLVDGIEIKYKLCDSSYQRAVSPPVRVSTPPHSVPAPDTPDTPCLLSGSVSPEFRLRSCVVIIHALIYMLRDNIGRDEGPGDEERGEAANEIAENVSALGTTLGVILNMLIMGETLKSIISKKSVICVKRCHYF